MSVAPAQQGEKRLDSNYTREKETKNTVKPKASKQTLNKPSTMERTLVVSEEGVLIDFQQDEKSARQEQLLFASVIMKIQANRPLYNLIASLTNAKIHMAYHMDIGYSNETLPTPVEPEVAA